MAYVFTPEIEAILAKGPPAIDWDGISEQLRRDFLRVCDSNGNRVEKGVTREEACTGFDTDSGYGACRPEVESRSSECREWSCLEGRARTCSAVAVVPSITVGTGPIEDLVAVGRPWLTFSKESVAELNRMGIDEAYSVHGTVGRTVTGAVVYRGSSDASSLVDYLAGPMFSRLAGSFKYVTAWASDTSRFATVTAHMFLNGGRVCGWSTAGATCYWCDDSGRVVHEYMSYDSGSVAKGDYCLCSKGEWLSVRDDEQGERDFAGYDVSLMGWPSVSPPRARSPAVVDLGQRFGGTNVVRDVAAEDDVRSAVATSGVDVSGVGALEGPVPRWTDVVVRSDGLAQPPPNSGRTSDRRSDSDSDSDSDNESKTDSVVSAERSATYFRGADEFDVMWERLIGECVSPLLKSVLDLGEDGSSGSMEIAHWSVVDLPSASTVELFNVAPTSAWMADGWCYLMVIVPRYRDLAASQCGRWISVDDLLNLPRDWISFNAMTKAVCSVVAEGKLHVHNGVVGGGAGEAASKPLFDELAGVATNPVVGRRDKTFGAMLEGAYPFGVFGSALVSTGLHHLLGAKKSAKCDATGEFLRGRVSGALAAAAGSRAGDASLAPLLPHVREVVGDFSFWGSGVPSQGFRPYALFPVPVASASGTYLPGVLWFDPALPPDKYAVYPLSSVPGWPVKPLVEVRKVFTCPELRTADLWKRLPVLLRNALYGGQGPTPKPLFPDLGLSWASGAVGEHFSLLAGTWVGLFAQVSATDGWYTNGVGPLALEPISGGLYTIFPGVHNAAKPECYVPPVHTWAPGTVVGELAMQWRRDHIR